MLCSFIGCAYFISKSHFIWLWHFPCSRSYVLYSGSPLHLMLIQPVGRSQNVRALFSILLKQCDADHVSRVAYPQLVCALFSCSRNLIPTKHGVSLVHSSYVHCSDALHLILTRIGRFACSQNVRALFSRFHNLMLTEFCAFTGRTCFVSIPFHLILTKIGRSACLFTARTCFVFMLP